MEYALSGGGSRARQLHNHAGSIRHGRYTVTVTEMTTRLAPIRQSVSYRLFPEDREICRPRNPHLFLAQYRQRCEDHLCHLFQASCTPIKGSAHRKLLSGDVDIPK